MVLRNYQSHENQYEETIPKEKKNRFQSFQFEDIQKARVQELLFFVNLVLFSLITVISSYIYLALGVPVFPAMLLASVTGFIGLRLIQFGLKKKFRPKQTRKQNKK
ncbi:TPA: DUF3270 domain-containing protein [Streptococcus suis]